MSARRKAGLLAAAALVMMGASTPTSCAPKPVPPSLSALNGPVTHGGPSAPAAGATCPVQPDDVGAPGAHGIPDKWGERVTAKDPNEWLSIHACYADNSAKGGPRITTGSTFTLYTNVGTIKGTVPAGGIDIDATPVTFDFTLKITSGTGSYKGATGTLLTAGCLDEESPAIGKVKAGWLNSTRQPVPAACKAAVPPAPPSLSTLAGPFVKGGKGTPDAGFTCPLVEGRSHSGTSYPGLIEKWTQGVKGADPTEWLSVNACTDRTLDETEVNGDYFIIGGRFDLYTATGNLSGTPRGYYAESDPDKIRITLTITGGTGSWRGAQGTLTYQACVAGDKETKGQLRVGDLPLDIVC